MPHSDSWLTRNEKPSNLMNEEEKRTLPWGSKVKKCPIPSREVFLLQRTHANEIGNVYINSPNSVSLLFLFIIPFPHVGCHPGGILTLKRRYPHLRTPPPLSLFLHLPKLRSNGRKAWLDSWYPELFPFLFQSSQTRYTYKLHLFRTHRDEERGFTTVLHITNIYM